VGRAPDADDAAAPLLRALPRDELRRRGRGELVGFLCGFLSQTYPDQAYVHFVGVRPDRRGGGLGRELYERFFEAALAAGRPVVRCVTAPVNEASVTFHTRLGFEIEAEVPDYDGSDEPRVLLRKNLS